MTELFDYTEAVKSLMAITQAGSHHRQCLEVILAKQQPAATTTVLQWAVAPPEIHDAAAQALNQPSLAHGHHNAETNTR